MGLFDFVSDIGKKVFSKEEDASKAVTQHIAEDNPGGKTYRLPLKMV